MKSIEPLKYIEPLKSLYEEMSYFTINKYRQHAWAEQLHRMFSIKIGLISNLTIEYKKSANHEPSPTKDHIYSRAWAAEFLYNKVKKNHISFYEFSKYCLCFSQVTEIYRSEHARLRGEKGHDFANAYKRHNISLIDKKTGLSIPYSKYNTYLHLRLNSKNKVTLNPLREDNKHSKLVRDILSHTN